MMTTSFKMRANEVTVTMRIITNIRNRPHKTNSDIHHGLRYLE